MYHGNGEVMKRKDGILQPDQALQQLLFMHLEGCGGILISHEFPHLMCIRTGASDIDMYEGPAEEMEKLCKAMLLHLLFRCPLNKWRHPEYRYHEQYKLFRQLELREDQITPAMHQHYGRCKHLEGHHHDIQAPAKFVYMLMHGVEDWEELLRGVQKTENDLVLSIRSRAAQTLPALSQ